MPCACMSNASGTFTRKESTCHTMDHKVYTGVELCVRDVCETDKARNSFLPKCFLKLALIPLIDRMSSIECGFVL